MRLAGSGALGGGGGRPGAGPCPRGGRRTGVLRQEEAPDEAGEAFRVLHRPFMQPAGQHDGEFLDGGAALGAPGLAGQRDDGSFHRRGSIKIVNTFMAHHAAPCYYTDYNTELFHD